MYRAPSKRRQIIKRTAVYATMTIGVIVLVTFLVLVMLGFRFNRDTSTIEQGGLVQFASRPVDASVTIGNAKLSDLTPSKITLNPGNYDVSMTRDGYLPWAKNVDVRAGEVLWLNYTQMTPEEIETKVLTELPTVAGVKSSPNGDRFAVLTDAKNPVLTFADVTGETPRLTTLTIPTTALRPGTVPTLTLGDWANDSDRLLVNATYPDGVERLLIDRRDAEDTQNLSTAYEADIAEVVFDPRSSERLIIRSTKGEVRTVNTSDRNLSSVIAASVSFMSLYGNNSIFLVQKSSPTQQSVGYVSLGSDTVRSLKTINSAARIKIAAAQYFSEPHIAISTGAVVEVFKVSTLPSSESDAPISLTSLSEATLPSPADYLSIRTGGRFVFAQYAKGVVNYDIELDKQTQTTFSGRVSGEIRWLDRYHFYLTNGKDLKVMEFDGGNPRTITGLTTKFDVLQSDNGTFIYSITAAKNGFAIQQSRMILAN